MIIIIIIMALSRMFVDWWLMEGEIFFWIKEENRANDFFDTSQEYFLLNDLFYMTYACLKSKKDFEWTEKNVLQLR